jgi:hypothetical protein
MRSPKAASASEQGQSRRKTGGQEASAPARALLHGLVPSCSVCEHSWNALTPQNRRGAGVKRSARTRPPPHCRALYPFTPRDLHIDDRDAHADHEPVTSGGAERRTTPQERFVAGSLTEATRVVPVGPVLFTVEPQLRVHMASAAFSNWTRNQCACTLPAFWPSPPLRHFAPVSPSGLLLCSSNGTPAHAAFPQSPAF